MWSTFRVRSVVVVRMAMAALGLAGVCQRYRPLFHGVSHVHSGGDAASLLAVAGRLASTDTRRCAACSCPWPPSSLCSTGATVPPP